MTAVAKPFPAWLARSRAWISIVLLIPAGVAAAFSRPHFAVESREKLAIDCLGWCLFLSGAMFRWWATLYIGGRKDGQVVSQGAYSVCRNPLYFGTFLLSLSVGVMMQSATLVAAMVLVSSFYLGVTVPVEEQRLMAAHGEAYRRYFARVPRFFPNFSLYQSPEVIDVTLDGLRAESLRALRWAWIPLVCQSLAHLRLQDWWPLMAALP